MCGIAGVFSYSKNRKDISKSIVNKMLKTQEHRGPDNQGVFIDKEVGVALGHNRLSIIDLSKNGNQPMISQSGRYVISFNGEIYNHFKLRKKVSDYNWKSNSDTETLLAVIENWGLEKTLGNIKGMFAFSLWDRKKNELSLIRDRFGEKPLYYYLGGKILLFSSDLKAITRHPSFVKNISRDGLSLMIKYSYIPSPKTIYKNTYKLEPGSYIKFKDLSNSFKLVRFWDSLKVAKSKLNTYKGTFNDARVTLDNLLKKSIRSQMLSDVPLGAFLSGGIDSSLIVSMMQSISSRPVKTFSIGFHEKDYNEAKGAKTIANYLKTDHTELYLNSSDIMDVIPSISSSYTEPFGDCSQIPTYLLSKMTKQSVTVSLSGDAGDELFGGYNRYNIAPKIWYYLRLLNPSLRSKLVKVLMSINPKFYNKILQPMQNFLPINIAQMNIADKIYKGSNVISSKNNFELYQKLLSVWPNDESVVLDDHGQLLSPELIQVKTISKNFIENMMINDTINYLCDDILVKVDRAAMSHSLETRVPFLDKDVFNFAWSIPINYKIENGVGKKILRELLGRYIPKKLFNRPKMGFALPIDGWLRGPLKDWAEDLLDPTKIRQEGFLSEKKISIKWNEHVLGKRNWQYQIWNVLMFQQWYKDNF